MSRSPSLSPTTSLTRSPAAYITWIIARSRSPRNESLSGASRSVPTSPVVSTFGSFRETRGRSISAHGSTASTRSRTRNFASPRTADRCRAADRAPSPSPPSFTR